MNQTVDKVPYDPVHYDVQSTQDILEKLQPASPTITANGDHMKLFMSNEARYYNRKKKQKESLGAKLKDMLQELQLKKHVRVRKQITEGKKIRDIEESLLESHMLKDIDPGTDDFEKLTHKEIQNLLNKEVESMREADLLNIIEE